MDFSDFRRGLSGEEFDKAGSDGRLYVFNKRKSDKDTRNIQKIQQGGKDDRKELALVTYPGVATGNDNLWRYEKPNKSKEHKASQRKSGQVGNSFGRGAYKPN